MATLLKFPDQPQGWDHRVWPERAAFIEALTERIAADAPFVLEVLEIGGSERVCDAYGYDAELAFLSNAAGRVAAIVAADAIGPYWISETRFALIFGDVGPERLVVLNETIERALRSPLVLRNIPFRAALHAGLSRFPSHDTDASALERKAVVALKQANARGRPYAIYEATWDDRQRARTELLGALYDALEAGDQFVLHMQPRIDVASGACIGAEALVRWQHPTLGLLGPDRFVPVLESSGLMSRATQIVVTGALQHAADWQRRHPSVGVSINISVRDLEDPTLTDTVRDRIGFFGVPPESVELEVTETALSTDPHAVETQIGALRALGVKVAVDDFGTGHAAFSYLKDLVVDTIKIDRSFLRDLAPGGKGATIVRQMIDLAWFLDLGVVAEGVETQAVLDLLSAWRCKEAQGYHIARPMPVEAFAQWLSAQASTTPPGGTERRQGLAPLPLASAV